MSPSATAVSGTRIDARVALAILVTILAFSSAFAAGRAALKGYSPEHIALLRFLIAAAVLFVLGLLTRMPLPARRDVPMLAAMGFAGFAFYNVVLNLGQRTVSAGASSLIVNISPVLVALLAGYFFHERLTRWAWIGFGICFTGVALIATSTGQGLRFSPGVFPLLLAACGLAIYSVGQKALLKRYSPRQFITYAIISAALMLLIFLPGLTDEVSTASAEATLSVVYLAIVTSVIGYGSWSYVLSRLPASRAGSFLYFNPAVATLVAWVWLGEAPAPLMLVGGALVLAGVIVVNTRGRAPALADLTPDA